MEQKLHHFVLQPDGVIGWIPIVPEKPVGVPDVIDIDLLTTRRNQEKWDKYQQALQSAISNAIEVSNFDETEDALLDAHATGHGFRLERNKPYSLLCSVEIDDVFTHCTVGEKHYAKRAFVTFSEPEEKNKPEPSNSSLMDHSKTIDLLEKYSLFLEKYGYIDTDWRTESPYAIDAFMSSSSGVEETQEERKIDLWNKVIELLMFCEADGTVVNGYRSQEIINQLRDITRKNK